MSDVSLHTDLVRIDEQSFRELYVQHWEKVFAVCYSNLQDREVAKEMVQDIFKSLWERRYELEISVPVERYLVRSAKFKVFEYLRNRKIRQEHASQAVTLTNTSANYTENEVFYNGLKEKLSNLVDTLPAQCKNVFRLSREQGLSNKEIASNLLISERAVEYHITRALSTLKTNLPEYFT